MPDKLVKLGQEEVDKIEKKKSNMDEARKLSEYSKNVIRRKQQDCDGVRKAF